MRKGKYRNMPGIPVAKQDWISVGLLIAYFTFFILVVGLFVIMRQEGTKCMVDPLNYGANSLAKREKADVLGTITIFNNDSIIIAFSNNANISKRYIDNLTDKSIQVFQNISDFKLPLF